MNKAAIYHRPESEYAYLYDENTVHIRLRTAKDITQVRLLYGDPYEVDGCKWNDESIEMTIVGITEEHFYWQVSVHPQYRRLKYGFHVISNKESCFFGDRGCYPFEEKYYTIPNFYFSLPYLHEIDRFKVPKWVTKTVWYQIFSERFANGNPKNDPDNVVKWESEDPTPFNFFGGDIQGIIDHLDYLESIGVNGLYLCPIFKATSNHKYDTEDYFLIDPHFGDAKLFKKFVQEAHRRGMRVMIDAVFNHMGDHSPQWQDIIEKGEQSVYKDWFHIHSFPVQYSKTDNPEVAKNLTYDTFAFTPHMPKWNTSNPEVQNYLLKVATYWIKEFDIDAWRLDVANEVDHHFWRKFHDACLELKPDFYILGEIWHSAQPWLQGDQFTGVMNYAYCENILQYFNHKDITSEQLVSVLNQQLMLYQQQVNAMNLNLLDSHDTPRIKWLLNGDMILEKQLLTFMFLQQGTPCIYYGTEIGMNGGADPCNRACMIWDESRWDMELLSFIKQLIDIRKQYSELLAMGTWKMEVVESDHLKLVRSNQSTTMTAYFNRGKDWILDSEDEILIAQQYNQNVLKDKGFVVILHQK